MTRSSHLWCPGGLQCEDEVVPSRFDPVYAASAFLSLSDELVPIFNLAQLFEHLQESRNI